jgi:predicted PurR-regulated permease PerM
MIPVRFRIFIYLALSVALIFLVVGLGYIFSNIVTYVIVSIIIATILRPFVERISGFHIYNIRIPRALAILLSFAFLILFIYSFLRLFVPLLTDEIGLLTELNYDYILEKVSESLGGLEVFLIENNLVEEKPGFILDRSREYALDFLQNTEFSAVINNAFSFLGSLLVSLLAVTFISFFFLYEKGMLRKLFLRLIPNSYFELTVTAFYKIEKLLSNYLIGLLFQMLAIFSLASILLSIAGIKYALTIAVFAATANLIPYLGPILGASFGIIVSLSTSPIGMEYQYYLVLLFKVAASFGIVQLADNIIFQPLIFSKSVKAHPLEIFVIVFVGATLAGPIGMIFAIPVYTIIRVSFIEFYSGYQEYKIFNLNQSR